MSALVSSAESQVHTQWFFPADVKLSLSSLWGTRGGRRRLQTAELCGRPSCSSRANLRGETAQMEGVQEVQRWWVRLSLSILSQVFFFFLSQQMVTERLGLLAPRVDESEA